MANCKLTKSLDNKVCEYAVAGARDLYLANFFRPNYVALTPPATPLDDAISYVTDAEGFITAIQLPTGESFYRVQGATDTISWADALLVGGNGGKYRQHTVNAVLNQYDLDILNEGDALSLGRFVAVVVDNAGRAVVLGRTGGISAAANGFDYNSGAAAADATGWTILLQGISMEIAPLLLSEAVITPIEDTV
jgi:hypothetical protein